MARLVHSIEVKLPEASAGRYVTDQLRFLASNKALAYMEKEKLDPEKHILVLHSSAMHFKKYKVTVDQDPFHVGQTRYEQTDYALFELWNNEGG